MSYTALHPIEAPSCPQLFAYLARKVSDSSQTGPRDMTESLLPGQLLKKTDVCSKCSAAIHGVGAVNIMLLSGFYAAIFWWQKE